uniref:SHSP domain-containing protein n=1 Tax=Chenopodium quinoa TaxID=63459 RepID=A0A803LLI9_CHEQI
MLGYSNHYHHLRSHTPPSLLLTDPTYTYDDSNYGGDYEDDVIIDPSTPSPELGPPKKKGKQSGPMTRKKCTHCGTQETPQWRFDDLALVNPGSSSGILDHPVSNSEKYETSPFTAGERTVMQLPSSGGSSNDTEADGQRKPWYFKQDDDALYFKMDMPGVRKKDAKISVEGSTLTVKGVRKLDPHFRDEENCLNTYVVKVTLVERHQYNIDGVKAELKHGVLKVIVPKVRDVSRIQTRSLAVVFSCGCEYGF